MCHISYKYYNAHKNKEKKCNIHDSTSISKSGLQFFSIGICFHLNSFYLWYFMPYIFSTIFCTDVPYRGRHISCCRYRYSTSRFPQYKHIIANGCLWDRGYFEALPSIYYRYHSGTIMDPTRGLVDIVKVSYVFMVSFVTCFGLASQCVLHMKSLITKYICVVSVYLLIIGDS